MPDLGAFLLAAGSRKRIAGVWDCCCLPCDWAIENGWPDPMAEWRGAYSTEEEGEALISDAGGLVTLFERGMGQAGLPRIAEPRAGDVGVICLHDVEAGAIFTGKRWAVVADRGLGFGSVAPEAVLAVWSIARG